MALHLLSLTPVTCSLSRLSNNGFVPRRVLRIAASNTEPIAAQTIIRRSDNYQPPVWSYDSIQSLSSKYQGQSFDRRVKKLKEDVRAMLDDKLVDTNPLHLLELIDTLQRLGISYNFEDEIMRILNKIYNNNINSGYRKQKQGSLYEVALEFRLLRQHGYDTPQEVFNIFRDKTGNFKPWINDDCQGILALYEAAYLFVEEESDIFHDIVNFTRAYLNQYVKDNKDECLSTLVIHALELPLHWRMIRLEARWFIDVYETGPYMKPILLELAKLDFNLVQAVHQEDVKSTSRWWRKTGLPEKLSFARDRLMECFFWTLGLTFEPQFGYGRRIATKVNVLITVIDDIYDAYGTLDELELFTDAVDRWDNTTTEKLSHCMKMCFLALFNNVNEMAYDILKEQGVYILPYLKKVWADLCKSYLVEAKWFNSGYIPALEEYIDNAWISISGPVILMHAYSCSRNPIKTEDLEYLLKYPNVIRSSSMILRLADDLGTSLHEMKRGDNPKSIRCYMHETGASEQEAREHIQELIAATWMKMNNDRHENSNLPNTFIEIAFNMARTSQCIYQHGDGHGVDSERETKRKVVLLLVNPIPASAMNENDQ